jgi:hypothetical protein
VNKTCSAIGTSELAFPRQSLKNAYSSNYIISLNPRLPLLKKVASKKAVPKTFHGFFTISQKAFSKKEL